MLLWNNFYWLYNEWEKHSVNARVSGRNADYNMARALCRVPAWKKTLTLCTCACVCACRGVHVCVSEKGCTEVLSWEHPVSDPCLSNCVERTLQCACTSVYVRERESVCAERERQRESEIEVQHKEQRSIVRCWGSSGRLRARRPHAAAHVARPEEKSWTALAFALCTDADSHRARWPPRCICLVKPGSTHYSSRGETAHSLYACSRFSFNIQHWGTILRIFIFTDMFSSTDMEN